MTTEEEKNLKEQIENGKKKLIGICIDIRNSTKLLGKMKLEELAKEISKFITEIYKILNHPDNKKFKDRSRHQGDGVLITIPIENDEGAFSDTMNIVLEFEKVIKNFSIFDIGIGIEFSDCIEINVPETPSGDKSLIVGKALSNAVKICKQVPFEIDKKIYYIKASRSFLENIDENEFDNIEIRYNKKRTMAFIRSE